MMQTLRNLCSQLNRVVAITGLMALLPVCPAQAQAAWTPAHLDLLDQAFVASVGADYGVETHGWQLFACDGSECMGNNPDTSYQIPSFDPSGRLDRPLGPTGALVLLMETPPAMRYFGLTSYMYSKVFARRGGRVPVAQSMSDTANFLVAGTTGASVPGINPFGQLAAFIVAADETTASDVSARLQSLGFPATAINRLDLPVSYEPRVPLSLGTGPLDDTFTVVLRMNYPQDAAAFASYLQRVPVRVHYLEPRIPRGLNPVPPTVFRVPGSGREPWVLGAGRDALIGQLMAVYGTQYSSITETTGQWAPYRPFQCLRRGAPLCFDNPDAAYTGTNGSQALGPEDRILVVGVDHGMTESGTGKSAMFGHALNDTQNRKGVLSVPDDWLHGTGLKAGGVTDPTDPRFAAYSRLYAFTLGYRCDAGDPVCITIPQDGANGAPPGTPLRIGSRLYLDPVTKTRPNAPDLALERSFLLRK